MIPRKIKELLKKQHYELIGKHSAVQICRWSKNSLRDEGVCYKEKFYGIQSHKCCQMTPSVVFCPNKCIHCWRAIEFTLGDKLIGKIDSPKKIIEGCIKAQRKLLLGFKKLPTSKGKRVSKANMEKWKEAQEPMQFAISLSGEPTLYEPIGNLIEELRKRGKTSFLVTNGLYPEKLEELNKKGQLPTQLYLSLNSPNEKLYNKWHNSKIKEAWKKFNETLKLFPKLKTRKVIRMTLVKGINNNMEDEFVKDYSKLIKKAKSDFIEIKGYKAVGFARNRKGMGYDAMPTHKDIKEYSKKIAEAINYKIEDESEPSCVVLLKKDDSVKRFIF